MAIADLAHDQRKDDCEHDPGNGNPRRRHSFVENPGHHERAYPAIEQSAEVNVGGIRKADTTGNPISASDDGQCPKRMKRDIMPAVNPGLISSHCGKDRQATQHVCVKRQHGICDPPTGFQQKNSECNGCKRLPEFRDFVINQRRKEPRAGDREQTLEGALVLAIACCHKSRCQVKSGGQDRQRDESRRDVRIRGTSL